MSKSVKILSKEDITPEECKWLKLKRTTFEDPHGSVVVWESIERTTKIAEVDGAAVLAKAISKSAPPQVIIIAQYRVPVQSYVLEAPAGLADLGESMEDVALRELKEETGYTGKAVTVSPPVYGEPGITDNSLKLVTVEVDLDDPCNADPSPSLETGELIEVFLLPLATLVDALTALAKERDFIIDSRLYMLALGIEQGLWLAASTAPPATSELPASSIEPATASTTTITEIDVSDNASSNSTVACSSAKSAKAGPSLPSRKTKASSSNEDAPTVVAPKGLGGGGGLSSGSKGKRVVPKGVSASKGKGKRGQQATEIVIGERELMALLGSGQIELADFGKMQEEDDTWEEDVGEIEDVTDRVDSEVRIVPLEVESVGEGDEGQMTVSRFVRDLVGEIDRTTLVIAGGVVGVCVLSIGVLALKASLRGSSK